MIRDSGYTGSYCSMAIFINGKQAGRLDVGQRASFFLPPDTFTIGAAYTESGIWDLGSGICSMGADHVGVKPL